MKRERGFTLIELITVAIGIAVMAAVLVPLALSSLRAYDTTLSDVIVLDKLRYATERLAREIREVNYNGSTFSYAFTPTGMGTNSISFTRTFYDSGGNAISSVVTVDTAPVNNTIGTSVRLAYANYPGLTVGPMVLTDQLNLATDLNFAYFDKNGCPSSTCPTIIVNNTNVRYVQITLTLTQNGNPYTQRTLVELRNR